MLITVSVRGILFYFILFYLIYFMLLFYFSQLWPDRYKKHDVKLRHPKGVNLQNLIK